MGCKMKIEKLFLIGFVIMLVTGAFMPQYIVMGDTLTDTMTVTFDPTGAVDGNVSPPSCAFGSVTFETESESSTQFTLYNNGTVSMKCVARQNQTTLNMTCDGDGGVLLTNNYAINITSGTVSGNDLYVNDVADTTLETSLAGSDTETFKLTLHLGDGTTNHPQQTTRINFTFSAA
jgi:hypothetical protein